MRNAKIFSKASQKKKIKKRFHTILLNLFLSNRNFVQQDFLTVKTTKNELIEPSLILKIEIFKIRLGKMKN